MPPQNQTLSAPPLRPAGEIAAADAVSFDPAARLTFEVSDGSRAMQLHRASTIASGGGGAPTERG